MISYSSCEDHASDIIHCHYSIFSLSLLAIPLKLHSPSMDRGLLQKNRLEIINILPSLHPQEKHYLSYYKLYAVHTNCHNLGSYC